MVQPINYGSFFQGQESPIDAFEQAFKSATGIRQVVEQREAAQRQAEAQAAMEQEIASVSNNPNSTLADYARLMTKYPERSEALKRSWETLSDGQQKSGLAMLSKATAAFSAGKPEVVVQLLKTESEALRNAGDESNAELYDRLARATEIDPTYGKRLAFMTLAGIPGGDKAIEAIGKVGAEARAQELQPIAVRRQTADAAGAEAEAITKGVGAKYAESTALKDLEERGYRIENLKSEPEFRRQTLRIQAMNSAIARESNDIKREQLSFQRDEAIAARESRVRENAAKAEAEVSAIDNALNTIDRFLAVAQDPKSKRPTSTLRAASGPIDSRFPTIQTDVANLEGMIQSMKSQAFLTAVRSAGSMAGLTEKEGDKLESSILNLDLRQGADQILKNIAETQRIFFNSRKMAERKYGVPPSVPNTPDVQSSTEEIDALVNMYLPKGR